MLIKIIQYTAADPQKPGDLARLLRYLLEAKSGDKSLDDFLRLAGPPFARRLIQRLMPFGATRRAAAPPPMTSRINSLIMCGVDVRALMLYPDRCTCTLF